MAGQLETRSLRVELEEDVHSLAFDDSGSLLAVGVEDNGIYVLDVDREARIVHREEWKGFTPYTLTWSRGFIAAGEGRLVQVCKFPSFTCCGVPTTSLLPPRSLAVTHDNLLIIGLHDGQLLFYSMGSWGLKREGIVKLEIEDDVNDVDYRDGRVAAAVGKYVYIVSRGPGGWQPVGKIRLRDTVFHVKWIDETRLLAETHGLVLVNTESGEKSEMKDSEVLRGAKWGPYFVGVNLNGIDVYLVAPGGGIARLARVEYEVEGLVEELAVGVKGDELRIAYVASSDENVVNILLVRGVSAAVKP